VGFSWLPLLKDGRLSSQEFSVPISCNLSPGYLAIKEAGNTKVRRETQHRTWGDRAPPLWNFPFKKNQKSKPTCSELPLMWDCLFYYCIVFMVILVTFI